MPDCWYLAVITRRAYIRRSPLIRKPRRYVVPPEILAYWDWIRTQPCAVCARHGFQQRSPSHAAHVGLRGLGQKCSGWDVLPLCQKHHSRGFPQSHHTLGKRFWKVHGIERYRMIRMYRLRYFGLTANSSSPVGGGFDREGL